MARKGLEEMERRAEGSSPAWRFIAYALSGVLAARAMLAGIKKLFQPRPES
jgi:hypothetical protein